MLCNQRLSIKSKGTGNIIRHLRSKHKREFEIIQAYVTRIDKSELLNESFVFEYFKQIEDNRYKCNYCDETFDCGDDLNEEYLFVHIRDKHPEEIVGFEPAISEFNDKYSIVVVKKNDLKV